MSPAALPAPMEIVPLNPAWFAIPTVPLVIMEECLTVSLAQVPCGCMIINVNQHVLLAGMGTPQEFAELAVLLVKNNF